MHTELYGSAAVFAMVVCYAFEDRARGWVLGFAAACFAAATYALAISSWPFAIAEGVWGIVALRRWSRTV